MTDLQQDLILRGLEADAAKAGLSVTFYRMEKRWGVVQGADAVLEPSDDLSEVAGFIKGWLAAINVALPAIGADALREAMRHERDEALRDSVTHGAAALQEQMRRERAGGMPPADGSTE